MHELDKRIIAAIKTGDFSFWHRGCREEAARIAKISGREEFRIIDGRLQALRKNGAIIYTPKTRCKPGEKSGWKLSCE